MRLFWKRNTASTHDMFIHADGESFEDFTNRVWREAAQEVKSESIARERRALRHRHRSTRGVGALLIQPSTASFSTKYLH